MVSKAEKRAQKLKQKREQVQAQREAAIRRKKNKKIINYSLILLAVVGVVYMGFVFYQNTAAPGQYDDFAMCLTQEGTAMFGTDWCPFCQEQKRLFGNSFALVTYINCDSNPTACSSEGVTSYPTWITPDGEKVTGVQNLEALSELSGCPIEGYVPEEPTLEGETQVE